MDYDLLNGAEVDAIGDITISGVTSGKWKGDITFNIEIDDNEASASTSNSTSVTTN